jgi:NADH-quinone oxidoreductase subunit K
MIPQLYNSLLIGAVLFVLGTLGFLTRRNLIVMFLSAELMLQAVALNLIAFGRAHGNYHGQSFAIFVLTVAACEAGIALVLFLALYQRFNSLDVSMWHELGETDAIEVDPEILSDQQLYGDEEFPTYPKLPPAGRQPSLPKDGIPGRKEVVKRG